MANVIPIFVAPVSSLLHQKNIGVTYVGISNFRMEPVISVPLYSMVMPQSMIIGIEAPFIFALVHIVEGVKSIPQTPRETKFVSFHEDVPRKVNNFFAS